MKLKILVEIDFAELELKEKYDSVFKRLRNWREAASTKAANLFEARSNAAAFVEAASAVSHFS